MPDGPDDTRADLANALNEDDAAAHLVLAWRTEQGQYTLRRVQTDDGLAEEFLQLARDAADQLLNGRHDVEYSPEWPLKPHEYFAIPNDPPPGGNLFPALADYANLAWFERRNLTKPSLYIVVVSTPAGTAFLGKRMAYLKVLGHRSKLLKLTWDGSTFHGLDDSFATFSRDFDWVVWSTALDTMYVLDAKAFHAEFRDTAALRAEVEEYIAQIQAVGLTIVNVDEMTERCRRSVPMASKLKHAVENGIMDTPIPELKKYAEERKIEVTWNGDSLVFEGTIERQWNVLKLIDEDRTEGPVSGRTYESSAKRRI